MSLFYWPLIISVLLQHYVCFIPNCGTSQHGSVLSFVNIYKRSVVVIQTSYILCISIWDKPKYTEEKSTYAWTVCCLCVCSFVRTGRSSMRWRYKCQRRMKKRKRVGSKDIHIMRRVCGESVCVCVLCCVVDSLCECVSVWICECGVQHAVYVECHITKNRMSTMPTQKLVWVR
jgi:hypothetical protein